MNARSRAVHLAANLRPPGWTEHAACANLTPQEADRLFFPDRGGPTASQALALCAGCPVAELCADAGAVEGYGIWGGSSVRALRGVA